MHARQNLYSTWYYIICMIDAILKSPRRITNVCFYLFRDVVEPKVENSGDYLGSLYDHVKALSCLVNDGQGEENGESIQG